MNATLWKVLKEDRFGLLIMEPEVRGCGVKRRRRSRCLGTKKVPGRSRLTLRCHDATNIRRRERKKERKRGRQSEKYQVVDITKYRIEGTYA